MRNVFLGANRSAEFCAATCIWGKRVPEKFNL